MGNTLNDDVLDHIFRACPTSSLTALSLVSSHFRILALPYLLRTISLDQNPRQLVIFLNFILDNTQLRKVEDTDVGPPTEILGAGRFILQLGLRGGAFCTYIPVGDDSFILAKEEEYPISTWAPILTRAFALMPNLQSISIQGDVEEIVSNSPEFALALFSRPQLTRINLWSIGPIASTHFGQAMNLRRDFIKLESVKFNIHEDADDMELVAGEEMGSVLFHSKGHLTEIDLEGCNLRKLLNEDASTEGRHYIRTPVIFPKLLTLTIRGCDVSLKVLARAFPAVRTLAFGRSPFLRHDEPTGTCSVSFPNLTSIRLIRHRDLQVFLESSDARDHVRRIVVDLPWPSDDDGANPGFAVTKALPRLKCLHFTHEQIMPLSWWKALVHTAPHLTCLVICVQTHVATKDVLDHLCVQVPRILASAPLAYVSLTLKGNAFAPRDDASPEIQSLRANEAIALSYGMNILTLKYIDICKEIKMGSGGSTSWWSVVRDNSGSGNGMGIQVKALDACEGRALRSWYDLEA